KTGSDCKLQIENSQFSTCNSETRPVRPLPPSKPPTGPAPHGIEGNADGGASGSRSSGVVALGSGSGVPATVRSLSVGARVAFGSAGAAVALRSVGGVVAFGSDKGGSCAGSSIRGVGD